MVTGLNHRPPENERAEEPPVGIGEAGAAAVVKDDFLGGDLPDPFSGDARERLGKIDVRVKPVELDGDLLCLLVDFESFDERSVFVLRKRSSSSA